MRRRLLALTLLGASLALAAGCSRSTGGGSGDAAGVDQAQAAEPSASANGPAAGAGGFAPSAGGIRGPVGAPSAPENAVGDVAAVSKLSDAAEIRTAQMTVAITGAGHVAQRADAAEAIAAREGGEVTADDRTSGRFASATVVLRVPPAVLQTTLRALSQLGTEKSRHLSTVDVTQQVADVSSRVISARDAIARLRVLYQRATRVRDVIRIEDELSSREADLESLQARQRALASRTSLATITLQLETVRPHKSKHEPAPVHRRGGFLGGLSRGWHGFVTSVSWLATALGTVLPFLLVVLVVGAVAWQLRRRAVRDAAAHVGPPTD